MLPKSSHQIIGWLCLAVIIFVSGMLVGRQSAPAKVEERIVEQVVYQDRVVEKIVEVKEKDSESDKNTKVVYVSVTKPDGTVITKTEVVEIEKVVERVVEAKAVETEKVVYVDKIVYQDRIIESDKPNWLVGINAGITPLNLSPVYGGTVDYRIAGPLFLGAWVNVPQNNPAEVSVGASVKFQF